MRTICIILLLLLLGACESRDAIGGVDLKKWRNANKCSDYLMEGAELMLKNDSEIIGLTQRKIKRLLGSPPKHELSKRGEKFFHYPLSNNCEGVPDQSLQIRFDALARVKELNIVLD